MIQIAQFCNCSISLQLMNFKRRLTTIYLQKNTPGHRNIIDRYFKIQWNETFLKKWHEKFKSLQN